MSNFKISADQSKILKDKGGEIKILISPSTVTSSHLIMGISKIAPGEIVKKHVHQYSEECFYVIAGNGALYLDDQEPIFFTSNDALFVPKGTAHSIKNIGNDDLFVVFSSSPLAPSPDKGHQNLFKEGRLCKN